MDDFTICGHTGSEAEKYANDNGFAFEALQQEATTVPTSVPTETPTAAPTIAPTVAPTQAPTSAPSAAPTQAPTAAPTAAPTTTPTFTPTIAPTSGPVVIPTEAILRFLLGDADEDDEVSILDATAIQRNLAGLPTTAFHKKAADADEDGEISILDATAIQRHLAGLQAHIGIGEHKNFTR